MEDRSSVMSMDLEDIERAIMAHRDQIEKLAHRRRDLLKALREVNSEHDKPYIVDIQDLIVEYKEYNPFYRTSELKEYLLKTLESDYGVGIVESYPMIDAAIKNELFRYRLKRR